MKKTLLKYLCMALPYNLVVKEGEVLTETLESLKRVGTDSDCFVVNRISDEAPGFHYSRVKPILRPLSTMTEAEIKDLANVLYGAKEENVIEARHSCGNSVIMRWRENNGTQTSRIWYDEVRNMKHLDWLLRKHFDFYELIPAKFALPTTAEYNPYII